nr:hypothetical protein [Tanacetum cinerariifolium]
MKDDDDKLLLCNTVILQICNIFIDSEEDSEKEGEAIRLPIPNGKREADKEVKETNKEEGSTSDTLKVLVLKVL